MAKPTKYIFVTGGVLSGLGKGITAASIANILKAKGLSVNIQKCDPYLNVDAGTLSPREHGECFVTKDGAETDLDLGHYERFLDEELTQASSLMAGRILSKVIADERAGTYQGQSVQIVPHVMNAITDGIQMAGEGFDVHIVEIGGTVGDLESMSFVEAIRECGIRFGRENCLYVHVVYLPYLGASKEIKTKPAQNAVRDLRGLGIAPDILVARSEDAVENGNVRRKLSMFCGVDEEAIALLPNAPSIYQVPLTLQELGIGEVITKKLNLPKKQADLSGWQHMVNRAVGDHKHVVKVGVVAKYLDNLDTYISVFEALRAAGWKHDTQVEIVWIDAEGLEAEKTVPKDIFAGLDGIVVPGGFGSRGVEGKIKAATYALDTAMPYLGLCLGMQVSVIAAARRAGIADANSTEFSDTKSPIISTMAGQEGKQNTGGTMRLGDYPCIIQPDSLAERLYGSRSIAERHRHRYECNNDYRDQYERWGIRPVGLSPDHHLVEMIEAIDHPFFLASQFHPEFKSRPNKPHPMFDGFIGHLVANKR